MLNIKRQNWKANPENVEKMTIKKLRTSWTQKINEIKILGAVLKKNQL
jgi:hypothetical protein